MEDEIATSRLRPGLFLASVCLCCDPEYVGPVNHCHILQHQLMSPMWPPCTDQRYGEKAGVALWLRVWPSTIPAQGSSVGQNQHRPWLFWIHGGAYCSGQHYQPRPWLVPLCRSIGFHVVSVAYRLAPEASMEDMIEDCLDGIEWCRTHLQRELADFGGVNIENYVIGGDSAGGGLATLLPFRLASPNPKAVINIYGVVDMMHEQAFLASMGSENGGQWKGFYGTSEKDIRSIIDGRDAHSAVTSTANLWNLEGVSAEAISAGAEAIALELKRIWGVSDAEWVFSERKKQQWNVKSYVGYARIMVTLPLRIEEMTSSTSRETLLKQYSASHLLREKCSSHSSYPPTLFLHGTGDTAVPVEMSQHMAALLRDRGVETEELYCEGKQHGWDSIYTVSISEILTNDSQSSEVEGWDAYIAPIGRFIEKQVRI